MDRNVKKIISIFAVVFIFCGWNGVMALLGIIKEIFVAFSPFFTEVAKQSIEDYLTSPYFVTGVILLGLSGCGIWAGKTGGKLIYWIVSIISAILGLVSFGLGIP